uniref:Predicted protein n=1 Tax=Hordeum vulgare subsp. vulgare TaxID=112509 RepID=F2E0K4_HORVV|nr:predicted protein [Hordeum vulgare subsp. vulgare]
MLLVVLCKEDNTMKDNNNLARTNTINKNRSSLLNQK